MNLIKTCFLLILCSALAATQAWANSSGTGQALVLTELTTAASGQIELLIESPDQRWQFELRDNRHSFAQLDAAQQALIKAGENRFMQGRIADQGGSWARLNRVDGQWSGAFHDGQRSYFINVDDSNSAKTGSRLIPLALPAGPASSLPTATGTLQVTLVADSFFMEGHGQANAATRAAARINVADGVFSSQTGIHIALHHFEGLADNGPLDGSDAFDLLVQFREYMHAGSGSSLPFDGVAHLLTRRPRDGTRRGIAHRLGPDGALAVCNREAGYGVNWDGSGNETIHALDLAHQLAHNFNVPHDDEPECDGETFKGLMHSDRDDYVDEFSNCSLTHMQPAIAAATCLYGEALPDPVFDDRFQIE